ncbi:phosphoribosylglycinamide formyltransferase [Lysobacter sp. A421]
MHKHVPSIVTPGPFRIAVLVSGRGSNLQAIIDAIAGQHLHADLVGVFSDRRLAPALERARVAGIPTVALRPRDFPDRPSYDQALFERIDQVGADLVVCAGYMRLLSAPVVRARPGRIINIHPSLLPAFKGLHTHQQALDAGADQHGASVHFVSAQLDGGPVISQTRVPVLPDDDAEQLTRRVLAREHPLLLATLKLLASARVTLTDDQVCLDGMPLSAPLQLDSGNQLHITDHVAD